MKGIITPNYTVWSNGFKYSVSYNDAWSYGPSRFIGKADEWDEARDLIKADIREQFQERNGIPLYAVSDHGNVERVRCIKLRSAHPRS